LKIICVSDSNSSIGASDRQTVVLIVAANILKDDYKAIKVWVQFLSFRSLGRG